MSKLTNPALTLALLTFCFVTAVSGWQGDYPVSTKTAGINALSAMPLFVSEVVKGRLGNSEETNKYHFWMVDLAPGDYRFVLDVKRADDQEGNLGGTLEWFSLDGENLGRIGHMNEIDDRARGVYKFNITKPGKRLVRYKNSFTISDYWLGLFPESVQINCPYFVHCPRVNHLELGVPASATLNGTQSLLRDAYYSIHLPSGDYKVMVDFQRADKTNHNVGGNVSVLGVDGETTTERFIHVNEIDFSAKGTAKLSLADDTTVILKLRASFTTEAVTLRIEPWREQTVNQ